MRFCIFLASRLFFGFALCFGFRLLPFSFGGGLRPTAPTFSVALPVLSIVDLSSSALSVMNGQLLADNATGYSDYVVQAVLNAMNVIRLKNDASVDMANGVSDWEGSEG